MISKGSSSFVVKLWSSSIVGASLTSIIVKENCLELLKSPSDTLKVIFMSPISFAEGCPDNWLSIKLSQLGDSTSNRVRSDESLSTSST